MTIVSIPLMDKTGRRTLHLYGLGGMFIFSIFITISFLIKASAHTFREFQTLFIFRFHSSCRRCVILNRQFIKFACFWCFFFLGFSSKWHVVWFSSLSLSCSCLVWFRTTVDNSRVLISSDVINFFTTSLMENMI